MSLGAKQLADAKAVVKNLTDVETLGATSAINTDKTGTLTMNEMMVSALYTAAPGSPSRARVPQDRRDHLGGRRAGARLHPARASARAGQRRHRDRRRRRGRRPTEAALVVLAAKLGVDAEETAARTRGWPRCRSTPSTSSWRRSTGSRGRSEHVIELVKGGADVVLARCGRGRAAQRPPVPIAGARAEYRRRQRADGGQGLRVLAFAARLLDDDELPSMADDPMSLTQELTFVGMAGIIDPLRRRRRGPSAPR